MPKAITIPFVSSSSNVLKKAWSVYRNEGSKSVLIKICKRFCPLKAKSIAKKLYLKYFFNSQPVNTSLGSVLFAPEIYQSNSVTPLFLTNYSIVVSVGLDWDYSNYLLLYWLKKKIGFEFVGAFYDGIPVVFPDLVQSFYFSQKFFSHLYYLIHLSDRIFCISDYSKSQLNQICEDHNIQNRPYLQTVHLGDSISRENVIDSSYNRNHNSNYVLYVSTIEARKNHKLLLEVWKILRQDVNLDLPDLVLVGMMGWGVNELQKMYNNDKALQQVVHFYDDVDDVELVSMYSNAKFTLFPSFVEGWGLGAVESMLYGKPCIISDCPALLEATQGLMPSLSAEDTEGWINMIKLFINNPNKIIELQAIIREKFQSRSWEDFSHDFSQFAKGNL